MEALNRFDFDTVLFPLNRVPTAHRNDYNDLSLWPKVIDAANRLRNIDDKEQREIVAEVRKYQPIFPRA